VKIGLVSDTHGSAKTFQKVLSGPFRDVELVLHAGDILYHGARNPLAEGYDTTALADAINGVKVPVLIARGNCDSDVDQLVLDMPIMSPYVFLYVEGKRIMVVHGDGKKDGDLEKLMEKFDLSLLVHGHSHIARIKKAGRGLIVNPGTPTIPNPSSPYKKTAGVFDSKSGTIEIWDIETGETVLQGALE
jgi:uncharacterized protein